MRTFSNFAVSFTIISILSGCLTLFGFAMNTGGPAVMTLGWLVVGFFVTLVALGMAEVASSYPTAGGLYYWAAKLAPASGRDPAKWSWFVGWFNLVGQVAVTAGIDFGLAIFTTAFLNLAFGVTVTPTVTVAVFGVMLILHALLNTFGIQIVKLLNDVSVWWHIVGVSVIVIVCVVINAHTRTSLGTVFTTAINNTSGDPNQSFPGPLILGIPLYVALIGLLNAQYTLTGYDASAHMSEETHDAEKSAPRGIVWSVIISVIFGFILLVAMNVGITPDKVFTGTDGSMVDGYTHALQSATGVPPVQIWIDAVGQTLGIFVLLIVIGAQFFCGMSSVTANSRMIYAFARDGAGPGQRLLAPDQQAGPGRRPTRSGSRRSARSSWAFPTCTALPPTSRSPRSRSSGYMWHTSHRSSFGSWPETSSRMGRGPSGAGAGRSGSSPRSGW